MNGLDVLQCIVHGGFGLYFVGFVVLGGVLSFFLPKDKARLGLALAALVMYGVCEFIATVICQGHLSAILAVYLGMLGLGMACGLALCSLGRRFAGRLAGR